MISSSIKSKYLFLSPSSAGGCSGSGFFSLLLSLFLADGVLDFLSFGDCDLFFAEDDLLPLGDLGDCDLELSPDFGLDGGAEPCSLVGNSGGGGLSTGSLNHNGSNLSSDFNN